MYSLIPVPKLLSIILSIFITLITPNYLCPLNALEVGDTVTGFKLESLDGKVISYRLDKVQGLQGVQGVQGQSERGVMLIFWASWCPNCIKEIPKLKEIYLLLQGRLDLLAINVDINDSLAKAKAYKDVHKLPYPVLYDHGSKVTRQYGVMATPTVLIVNEKGLVRYRNPTVPDVHEIEKHL